MEINKNKEKLKRRNYAEMYYDTAELSKLKYVKIAYRGSDNKLHEVSTEVKFMGDVLISLYFQSEEELQIKCPQDVMIKFVTVDGVYMATSSLQEVKRNEDMVYFSVVPPLKMIKQQNRRYSRVDLIRNTVLVVSDDKGKSSTYLSKSLNLSASGILINKMESMFSSEYIEIPATKYDCYHIMIFLEQDLALKLFARLVRHDNINGSHRYAFQFLNMKPHITELVDKYVTEEQLNQLKIM